MKILNFSKNYVIHHSLGGLMLLKLHNRIPLVQLAGLHRHVHEHQLPPTRANIGNILISRLEGHIVDHKLPLSILFGQASSPSPQIEQVASQVALDLLGVDKVVIVSFHELLGFSFVVEVDQHLVELRILAKAIFHFLDFFDFFEGWIEVAKQLELRPVVWHACEVDHGLGAVCY